ncbi:hypothetical protein OS493_016896 [Desmophyllum pertusum]|uniref:Uncharacterized protein n=1 Tax=Desmophyllum pertusum TaxID=174260 RepID=A0A9X0CKJ0_9CNID|nr:hypothetical protein OS493_016896 [Desmophyllum pertusum]
MAELHGHTTPAANFTHRRTVRLMTEEGMRVDVLTIAKSLPDYTGKIRVIVPLYGGKCFDITLDSPELAAKLAQSGFDYETNYKTLTPVGAPDRSTCLASCRSNSTTRNFTLNLHVTAS